MEFYQEGDKFECQNSEIIAKRIIPSIPQNFPKIGLSLKYKCERDGTVEIKKELNPKKYKIDKKSHLNQGDKLSANHLFVIVKNIKRLKLKKVGGHSGRHNSQKMNTKDFTYAEISKPYFHIMNAIEKRKEIEK
ncbi:MAG: hypothetical protein U9R42_00995 [Bacteroidota bacterium]|nr:hypothetical protein [Bacteroidota bacterium]